MIDKEKLKEHVIGLLEALGEDASREGLRGTPERVCRMYEEVFEGINYTNSQIAGMFNTTFEEDLCGGCASEDLVMVKDIDFFSHCEHHLALMYNMKATVAYIPKGKIIGISKIARIVDMVGRRLQVQERIGNDIAQIMQMVLGTQDVAVIIEGEHACMTMRGIKKKGAITKTVTLRGRFKENTEMLKL